MSPRLTATPDAVVDPSMPDVTHHFHPVLRSKELVQQPVRVILSGRAIVLYRTPKGKAVAMADQCPHRRTPLSKGTVRPDGRLQCAYHGWHFDEAGDGCAPQQPKLKCQAHAYRTVERLGYIWVAKRSTPASAMPAFARDAEELTGEWEGFEPLKPIVFDIEAPLEPVMDNFSEIEHVPHVHVVLGWKENDVPKMTIELEKTEDGSICRAWGPQREAPMGPLRLVDKLLLHSAGTTSLLQWGFKFSPVHLTFMPGWGDPETGERRVFSVRATTVLVPISPTLTRLINFPFLKIHERRLQWMRPILRITARSALKKELILDGKFCEMVGDVPFELKGMRLGAFDRQLVYNRRLLKRLYYGNEGLQNQEDDAPEISETVPMMRAVGQNND
jgi:phenylpropionate dioxygenase-like ring-hydroxylating dioxygenase large terminal subunit